MKPKTKRILIISGILIFLAFVGVCVYLIAVKSPYLESVLGAGLASIILAFVFPMKKSIDKQEEREAAEYAKKKADEIRALDAHDLANSLPDDSRERIERIRSDALEAGKRAAREAMDRRRSKSNSVDSDSGGA
jgi:hypothetical protein